MNRAFLVILLLISLIGCASKEKARISDKDELKKEIFMEPFNPFKENLFENISFDPFDEFARGYSKIENAKKEVPVKEAGDTKIFLSDNSIVLMYYKYGDTYELRTVKITGDNSRHSFGKFIGQKKSNVEKYILAKPSSNNSSNLHYDSDDWIYFIDFSFDSNDTVKEIVLGFNM